MDLETIQILLDLLNPLHGSVDKQIMDQVTDERELDAPSDREYNVDVTARMERDLTQAVCILEDRKRQATVTQVSAMTDTQQLVARIKRSSKYYGQTEPGAWFDVRVVADTYYHLRGNNNNYRLSDVALGMRLGDGSIVNLINGSTVTQESLAHESA